MSQELHWFVNQSRRMADAAGTGRKVLARIGRREVPVIVPAEDREEWERLADEASQFLAGQADPETTHDGGLALLW